MVRGPWSVLFRLLLASSIAAPAFAAQSPFPPGDLQPPVEWVRPGLNTNLPIWGIQGALLWGLPPATGRPPDGPRGLIRLRYPTLPQGEYDLINFIAIEPVVQGRKGFSELERSQLDPRQGKRLRVLEPAAEDANLTNLSPGEITRLPSGAETLTVRVGIERFENGAHLALTLAQCSDAPDELELTVHAEPDSAPLEYCILTATMGNKARARRLWLKDAVVSSLELYPDYREPDFAPHHTFGLNQILRTPAGDLIAAITTDEANPSSVNPYPKVPHWRYAGFPVTQFWRKPADTWRDDLRVAVNARHTYWLSRHPIPGGISFENFELRERFHDNQRFIFGITRKPPTDLGFVPLPDPSNAPVRKP